MADPQTKTVVCAGHICLDIIPRLLNDRLPPPGGLAEVGPADVTLGGSVSNTGLALHRLGLAVRLIGRVGDDDFGQQVTRRFENQGVGLAEHLIVDIDSPTSYTVVLSPPAGNRRFLHCPGANGRFVADDVSDTALRDASHLHFGYPPAMQAIALDGGKGLASLFERARRRGLTTSLDLCGIDAQGWAGKVDWPAWLGKVLPWVDLFMPSADELAVISPEPAERWLDADCTAIVVKDGARGLRVMTGPGADRLGPGWADQRLAAHAFDVPVVGTTGAGDTTIAGFLAAFLAGHDLDTATTTACAVGAHCVQTTDALSGVPSLNDIRHWLAQGPPRKDPA